MAAEGGEAGQPGPLHGLRSALDILTSTLDARRREAQHGAGELLRRLQRRDKPGLRTIAGASSREQQVADLQARVASIPVYTVANRKNEFVLVLGEGREGTVQRQMGLLFLKKSDAHDLLEEVAQQNPQLAKSSQVLKVSMDSVYPFVLGSPAKPAPESGQTGPPVVFRFVPDMEQVRHALQLHPKDVGPKTHAFRGVPVFQADGLSVKTDAQRYTPLFLCKEDLDTAVSNAYTEREQARRLTVEERLKGEREHLDAVQKQEREAVGKREKRQAGDAVRKATQRLERHQRKLEASLEGGEAGPPQVEVGSLEEVLHDLTAATPAAEGWRDVMFIPAGACRPPEN